MDMTTLYDVALTPLAYIAVFGMLFLVAKWIKDLFTPYSLNKELAEHDNTPISLTMAGYYIAVALIFVSQLSGPSQGLKADLLAVSGYSLIGILMLNLSRWINDKAILRTFCNIQKLTQDKDIGVGVIQFAVYLSTGLIAAGSLGGQGTVLSFLVFFVLGQASLVLFSVVYSRVAPYHLYDELDNQNTAVAVAFSGTLVGTALLIKNGVSGDFSNWQTDLSQFAVSVVLGLVLLPLLLRLFDRLVVPGKSLNREMVNERSVASGLLVAAMSVSFGLVITQLV